MKSDAIENTVGSIRLGIAFTAMLALGFLSFILLGAYLPSSLSMPIAPASTTTWAFIAGLGLIASTIIFTGVYVLLADLSAMRRQMFRKRR